MKWFFPSMLYGVVVAAALVALIAPRTASAEELLARVAPENPHNAVSILVPALGDTGLAAQYERFILPAHWSLCASLAIRSTARGDYDSLSLSAGAELRYWWQGHAFRSILRRAMVGLYASTRLDIERTSLQETGTMSSARSIGAMTSVAASLSLGYRFALWHRIEITPSLGPGWRVDIDAGGMVPARARGVIVAGLTAGWLF